MSEQWVSNCLEAAGGGEKVPDTGQILVFTYRLCRNNNTVLPEPAFLPTGPKELIVLGAAAAVVEGAGATYSNVCAA
jgi:hypothetical protein